MRFPSFMTCFVLGLGAGGCDIDVRSVRTSELIPAELEGVWQGTWQSGTASENGLLTLELQEWQGQAVVSVATDNPCVEPQDYELKLRHGRIELLADGEPVFAAVLGPNRTLVGTYTCHEDHGTWLAEWSEALPPIIDLSGSWLGTVSVPGFPAEELEIELEQSVRNGLLALDGVLVLPALETQVLVTGGVVFRHGAFDVLLTTLSGSNPGLLLTGFGSHTPLQVDVGVFTVTASMPPLPFSQGVWQVSWQR